MEISVRNYERTDFENLRAILNGVYGSHITQDVLEKNYLTICRNIVVAVNNLNLVLGCAFVEIQMDYVRPSKVLFVTYVAVDKYYRKCGIGTALMKKLEEIALSEGCNAIEFTSANYRTGAHNFYKSLGYLKKDTTVFIKEM